MSCGSVHAAPETDGRQPDRQRKLSPPQLLLELCHGMDLFHTPGNAAHATVLLEDHRETWSVRSAGFSDYLRHQFYREYRSGLSSQSLQDALATLEARARYEGPQRPVSLRVAALGNVVYLDLCNDGWEVVEITAGGWRIVQDCPVRFRRTQGMGALPHPERGGSLAELRE
jgi:hypothetical protein